MCYTRVPGIDTNTVLTLNTCRTMPNHEAEKAPLACAPNVGPPHAISTLNGI
jgi:hypothetical protein